ncbi:MAG: hypothetical protein R3E79_55215 [Caldilineaceae bacterium]
MLYQSGAILQLNLPGPSDHCLKLSSGRMALADGMMGMALWLPAVLFSPSGLVTQEGARHKRVAPA